MTTTMFQCADCKDIFVLGPKEWKQCTCYEESNKRLDQYLAVHPEITEYSPQYFKVSGQMLTGGWGDGGDSGYIRYGGSVRPVE